MAFLSSENNLRASAVIVAAGASVRMGKEDKILLKICDAPIIIHTLRVFDCCDLIEEIIVVTRENLIAPIQKLVNEYQIKKPLIITSGGNTRGESVLCGIEKTNCPILCIHDGARPLVTQEVITNAIIAVVKHGASTVGVPVKDTVKIVDNDIIKETPDRNSLIATQTPQVFLKELYLECLEKVGHNEYSDDCQLFEQCGKSVFVILGDYKNIKITTAEDLLFAETILKGE